MVTKLTNISHTRTSGFSTIEILIAFSVGIIFLTAAMMVSFSDPTLARQISLDSNQATALDATLDNTALATSSNRLGSIVAMLATNWNTHVNDSSDAYYYNDVSITDISPCLKEINNATTWNTLGDRSRHITFGTALGDIATAATYGRGGCDPLPSSGWDNPESDNLAQTNVSGADNATDIEIRSIDGKRYAFITTNPTGGDSPKVEFTVIDVTDIDIDPNDIKNSLSTEDGLLGLTIADNYAYVLNDDIIDQLQIVDISNPETPLKLVSSYTLPKITCTYHNQNCQRKASSIAYYDGYLYIGTGYMAGNSPEFHIYCISDNAVAGCSPTTPVWRGSLNLNHNVNDIALKGTYAYLATSAEYAELTVVDVSNKISPTAPPNYTDPNIKNRKFNAPNFQGSNEEDGYQVNVLGDYVYLGRGRVSHLNERDFYILSINDLTNITSVGALTTGINSNGSRISGLEVRGKTAFVATTDSNQSLFIIDVSNPTSPYKRNNCSEVNTSQGAIAMDFRDNLVFLAHTQGSTLLKIIYDQGNACTP